VRVHVAFTPEESAAAPTGVVIDVIRATSTICQALASGYERVLCAAEVEQARALRDSDGRVTLGVEAAAATGDDVAVFCAGVKGAFALDDAYVAGRVAEGLGGERSDAAEAALRLARSYASAEEAFRASRSGRNLIDHGPELEADIPYCARESVLSVVPKLRGMHGVAAEIGA